MSRHVNITPTSTIFIDSKTGFISIPTKGWVGVDGSVQPYSDILHSVQEQIRLWMEGTHAPSTLIERLEIHGFHPKVVS